MKSQTEPTFFHRLINHQQGVSSFCKHLDGRSAKISPPLKPNPNNTSKSPSVAIPSRLKCSLCANLALNPVRLPCCEKSICSQCTAPSTLQRIMLIEGQKGLPDSCPLCEYHPLLPGDCVENVPLRKTVLAFSRNLELKGQVTGEAVPLGGQGTQVGLACGIC